MEKMVKRLLSVVIALAMVIAWLPGTALKAEAVSTTDTCPCGCGKVVSAIDWTSFASALANNEVGTAGHYYLSGDLTVAADATLEIYADVTLDLRGNSILRGKNPTTRTIMINQTYSLTVIDTVGGGEIIGGDASQYSSSQYGAAIFVDKNATLNLVDVVVRGGKALRGGNVFVAGTATITGKTRIVEGEAVYTSGTTGRGGNIYVEGGNVTVAGYAKILDGVAPGGGGNVYVQYESSQMTITGRATVAGGKGGSAGGSADNIYTMYSNLTIGGNAVIDAGTNTGNSISIGNTDKNSNLTITGGTIYGKIVLADPTTVTVSGAPVIQHLYLAAGQRIDPTGLTDGASICVESADGVITGTVTNASKYVPYFKAYTFGSTVNVSSNQLKISNECPCGCGVAVSNISWTSWSGGAISQSGHYRLSASKTITSTVEIATGVKAVVDLNGQTLTASGARAFKVKGTLFILDSSSGGKIVGADIQTGSDDETTRGGAIYVDIHGTVNLHSGTITGGKAQRGGNIYNNSGVINIYGGTITGGQSKNGSWGGNIQNHGKMYVYGGEVVDPTSGPNIYTRSMKYTVCVYDGTLRGSMTVNGSSLFVYGGTVSGGTITLKQYYDEYARLTVTGGTVSNAIAVDENTNAEILISGGTISGAATIKSAKLVHINGGNITARFTIEAAQKVHLSGAPIISSLYLKSGVKATAELDPEASVTYYTLSQKPTSVTVTPQVTWSISGNTLTISGSGDMPNYARDTKWTTGTPWANQADSIASVVIKSGVKSVGDWAFAGLKNLTSVSIENTVKRIGSNAFRDCTSLQSINIYNTEKICDNAFNGCTALKSVTANGSLTYIDNYAFFGCSSFTGFSNTNVRNVKEVGRQAFDGCDSLTAFGNWFTASYQVVNGYLCSADGSVLIQAPGGLTGAVTIPAGITEIAKHAFSNCKKITSVSTGDEVTLVDAAAFDGCTGMVTFNLGANATIMQAKGALANCDSLTTINVSSDHEKLSSQNGIMLSKYGTVLYRIPGASETFTITKDSAVNNVASFNNMLQEVIIDSNFTTIASESFMGDTNLKTVHIPATVTQIQKSAFEATGITDVYYGGTLAQWETLVANTAAYNEPLLAATVHCTVLEDASCGNGVTVTMESDGLLTVSGTGPITATPWSQYADMITTVVIEEGVTGICADAFSGCENLTTVTLPESLTDIGDNAFADCAGLTSASFGGTQVQWDRVTKNTGNDALIAVMNSFAQARPVGITITKLPTKLDYSVGETVDITGMEVTVNYNDDTTIAANLADCTVTADMTMPGKPLVTVTYGDFTDTFPVNVSVSGISGATTWTLDADGLLTISGNGEMAYDNTAVWAAYMKCITAVVIEEGVTGRISKQAFPQASNMRSVVIPEGITYIGSSAFYKCTSLTEVILPSTVENIRGTAFSTCTALQTVTIGKNVTEIAAGAFDACTALTTVNYGGSATSWNGITIAGSNDDLLTATFVYGEKELVSVEAAWTQEARAEYFVNEEVDLTGLVVTLYYDDQTSEETADYTVEYDFTSAGTKTVTIKYNGQTVTSYDVTVLPAGITENGLIWNITAEGQLTILGQGSIADYSEKTPAPWAAYADSITQVMLDHEITAIGAEAFKDCVNLTSVMIPKAVVVVGADAFSGCIALTDVSYTGLESEWATVTIGQGNECLTNANISYQTLYGDVDGDGRLSTLDSLLLMKKLAGWDVEIDKEAADVDGDGRLSTRDSLLLMKKLAGYNVTLGPAQ